MAEVVWTGPALASVQDIVAYIAQFRPLAAQRMAVRLRNAGDAFSEHPLRGRAARGGRRELVTVAPCVITYQITAETVEIIGVRHAARRRS